MADKAENRPSVGQVPLVCEWGSTPPATAVMLSAQSSQPGGSDPALQTKVNCFSPSPG